MGGPPNVYPYIHVYIYISLSLSLSLFGYLCIYLFPFWPKYSLIRLWRDVYTQGVGASLGGSDYDGACHGSTPLTYSLGSGVQGLGIRIE